MNIPKNYFIWQKTISCVKMTKCQSDAKLFRLTKNFFVWQNTISLQLKISLDFGSSQILFECHEIYLNTTKYFTTNSKTQFNSKLNMINTSDLFLKNPEIIIQSINTTIYTKTKNWNFSMKTRNYSNDLNSNPNLINWLLGAKIKINQALIPLVGLKLIK